MRAIRSISVAGGLVRQRLRQHLRLFKRCALPVHLPVSGDDLARGVFGHGRCGPVGEDGFR
jgi:hypothetical protein